ncbi:MAG: hypothetical protein HYR55_06015 [Acidobacteria bacterium]|nr:hypothetical protein [Acidobacteriota bacterium]
MASDGRDEIIRNFDRVRLALASDRWTLSPDASIHDTAARAAEALGVKEILAPSLGSSHLATEGLDVVLDKIRQHQRTRASFYRAFDYAWTLNPLNYTSLLECLYQQLSLEVLADIDPRHPNWRKLNHIAIRVVPTGSLNAECLLDRDFKYVMLSTPFLKILQATLATLKILATRGRQVKRNLPLWVRSNHLNGRYVELALRDDFDACQGDLLNLLADVFYYATHGELEIPNARAPRLMDTVTDKGDFDYLILYEATEMFVVCHELAHILEHDLTSRARTSMEEHQADYYGASLYLIYNSMNMKTAHGFLSGPALFFSVMRSFVMCRNLLGAIQKEARWDAPEYVDEENVLKSRAFVYEKYNKEFGTVPDTDVTYKNIMAELWILTAACQVAILRQFDARRSPSLDDLLPKSW